MSLTMPKSQNTRRSSAPRDDPTNATNAVWPPQPHPSLRQFADTTVVVKRPRVSVSSHTGGGAGVGDGGGDERFSPIGDDLDLDDDFDVDLDLLDGIIYF